MVVECIIVVSGDVVIFGVDDKGGGIEFDIRVLPYRKHARLLEMCKQCKCGT
jgi:hypothetical protein